MTVRFGSRSVKELSYRVLSETLRRRPHRPGVVDPRASRPSSQARRQRPRTHKARELLDAIFYAVRGGCASIPAGFEVVKRSWVVERTFAWIMRNRRMRCDYEFLAETTEALVYVCMIRLMLKRLANGAA